MIGPADAGRRPLDRRGRLELADALGDTPETAISVHLLRRGLCRAYVAGDPAGFEGAVIQALEDPGEPTAFGADAQKLRELLRSVEGWWCVNVPPGPAPDLADILEVELCEPVRLYGDVYHVSMRPTPPVRNPAVRLLTVEDLALVEAAPAAVRGGGFENARAMLTEGVAAGAVVSGELKAIAHTHARTERHADIGVSTLEPWRGRGFASAAASLVARRVRGEGQVPVWSTGEDNLASLRVARKLGFSETLRRTYVIPGKVRDRRRTKSPT